MGTLLHDMGAVQHQDLIRLSHGFQSVGDHEYSFVPVSYTHLYVLIGVGIGALIHNWIPEDFIVKVLGDNNPFGVVLATIAGVPMLSLIHIYLISAFMWAMA